MFTLKVERQVEAAHRNGPPSSRCFTNHGHSWLVTISISFGDDALDEYGWGLDFRTVKDLIEEIDHQDLNNLALMGELPASSENLARVLYYETVLRTALMPDYVEVREGKGNSIRYTGSPSQPLYDPRGRQYPDQSGTTSLRATMHDTELPPP